ncbi:unnamed protein product [Blepharisma stoltei]|uniref:Uncharacterized protein n=1 Tax=Blepharisma stoltei TaxID=1481888 RepID=A0AAU9ISN9_9CILI|nr:unnamed protein product [Blepharisma stoltei]
MLIISFLWINFECIPLEEETYTRIRFFENWETDDHINDVHVQMLQARHYMKQGSWTDAEGLLNNCLHHLYESADKNHPLFNECMQWLAECYSSLNNNLCSLKLLEKVLAIQIENLRWYDRGSIRNILDNINAIRSVQERT